MKNLFSALPGRRWLTLALGLLGTSQAALAQSSQIPVTPTTVYGLGYNVATQATFIVQLNPANLNNNTTLFTTGAVAVNTTPLGAQRLVSIDARPSTGQLYGLGYDYNQTTNNARLYALTLISGSYTLTPVGGLLTLDLQDPTKGRAGTNSPPTAGTGNTLDFTTNPIPTTLQLYNVVFDFNPRADRIRVSAPRSSNGTSNGITYVLNPNTGAASASSAITGSYTDGQGNAVPYYVGTGAYTNSAFGVAGTTLYDLTINNVNGKVVTQNIATGGLTQQANLTFALQSNGVYSSYVGLNSPTVRLDLDFYYDRGSSNAQKNIAYVLEARRNPSNNGYSSNLYTLDFSSGNATSGQATGKNIYGAADASAGGGSFIYDIAALSTSPKIWIGSTSSVAWSTASNWYPSGVPTSADDVLIPGTGTFVAFANTTVASQPTVSDAQVAASVTLSNGAILTTANGGTLSIQGDFVNNDSQVDGSGNGTIALVGPATEDIGGNTQTNFWNLSVGTNGATTSAAVAIRRSVAVSGTLAIGTDQAGTSLAFTLLSSASGTAYLTNNGGTVSGLATVQRYITPTNPGSGYRHYSSPVTRNAAVSSSNQINDLAVTGVFTPTVNANYNSSNTPKLVRPYPTVFYYDQSRLATSNSSYAVGNFDNGFLSPADYTTEFEPARGYTVNLPAAALVDFQGTPNQAAQYQRTNLARGAQTSAGYHLLGNPYPGALNYDLVATAANIPGMESALYVYKSSGQYTGTYTTYVPGSVGTNGGPGVSANGGTNNIPLGQGFFMRTAAGQTGSVTIPTAARTNAPETALFQRTASTLPLLALTVGNGSIANQTAIYFDQTATPDFDATRDAHYLPATHGLDLASDIGTEALAINGLPLLTGTTVAVPLRLHAPAAGTYTLTVDELANLPGSYSAYLRDNLRNTYTNLATTPSLPVALDPADAATGRFTVVFSTTQPLANAPATLAALVSLYPNPTHGAATLVLPQALRGQAASQVEVLNALGQVVLRRTVAAGTPEAVELPLTGLAAGIYTVRAVTATGAVARQLRVE